MNTLYSNPERFDKIELFRLRRKILQLNENFEGKKDSNFKNIMHLVLGNFWSIEDAESLAKTDLYTLLTSLDYRITRYKEIQHSKYSNKSKEETVKIIFTYYITLMYIHGYSKKQIKQMLKYIRKIKEIQPEASIMGVEGF